MDTCRENHVEAQMEALAGQMNELLQQHPIQRLGSRGWAVIVYPRDELWFGYQQMPGGDWREPLVEAIDAYRTGMSAYNRIPESPYGDGEEDANIARTYGPPFDVLDGWDQPALTAKGAREALRLVLDEQMLSSGFAENMVRAALCWLEKGSDLPSALAGISQRKFAASFSPCPIQTASSGRVTND